MKYLFLLLVSFNCLAQYKASINNHRSGRRYAAKFETMEELNVWKLKQESNDSWGKKDRWIEFRENIPCDTYRDTELEEGIKKECFRAQDYSVKIEDVSVDENIKKTRLSICAALIERLRTEDLGLIGLNKLARCRRGFK